MCETKVGVRFEGIQFVKNVMIVWWWVAGQPQLWKKKKC